MADSQTFTKDELDAAIEKAIGGVTNKLEELENKNTGLLDDLKKAQREARAAKDIKPEDLAAAEDRAEKAEAELTKVRKEAKDAEKARDTATKALEAEQGFTQKLLKLDGLKSALIANGVKDEDFIDSLTAKFASSVEIVAEGDDRKPMLNGKPLSDAIKEWAGSDAGKKFVSAAANSGGGAGGGKGATGSGKTMTQEALNALKPAERAGFFAEGGRVVDQAA